MPSIEKLRFVSSGTEATMSAIRLARAFTNRKYIIKFEGCYHGHADGLLVKAGSGVATFGIPGSAGVPEEIAHFTLALPYNDIAAVEAAFAAQPRRDRRHHPRARRRQHGLRPAGTWLSRRRCASSRRAQGALLIFDEVMTGFRVALGRRAAALRDHARPDLPGQDHRRRPALRRLRRPSRDHGPARPARPRLPGRNAQRESAGDGGGRRHARISRNQQRSDLRQSGGGEPPVAQGVATVLSEAGGSRLRPTGWVRCGRGSSPKRVVDFATAAASDTALFGTFHRAMLDAGVWLPPSQFEAIFIGIAHGEEEVRATVDAARAGAEGIARCNFAVE